MYCTVVLLCCYTVTLSFSVTVDGRCAFRIRLQCCVRPFKFNCFMSNACVYVSRLTFFYSSYTLPLFTCMYCLSLVLLVTRERSLSSYYVGGTFTPPSPRHSRQEASLFTAGAYNSECFIIRSRGLRRHCLLLLINGINEN